MGYVFISYSSHDRDAANEIVGYLERNQIKCYIDHRDIPKGQDWDDVIPVLIKSCDAVFFLVSKNFMSSDQVKKEVKLVINEYKKFYLAFRLDDTPYSVDGKVLHMSSTNCIMATDNYKRYFPDILSALYKSGTIKTSIKIEDFKISPQKTFELEKYIGTDTDVVVPDYIKSIGFGCFYEKNIEIVTLGDTVSVISDWAFYSCKNLRVVNLSENIARIGKKAFENSYLYGKTGGELIIGNYYIRCIESRKKIKLDDSVILIADGAFEDCTELCDVRLSDNLKYIGADAFKGCTNLKSLTIGSEVAAIGKAAFCDSGIKTLYCDADIPPQLDEGGIFSSLDVTVKVKGSSKKLYSEHPVWSKYVNKK